MSAKRIVRWMAIAAVLFGAMTVLSGGRALFGGIETREALGSVVFFVLWFNFLAGFVYIIAGAGLLAHRRWAAATSLFLAVSTALVFGAFGAHIIFGGAFEMRTVMAMTIRSLFWIVAAAFSMRAKAEDIGA